jgi:hypothetical protein
MVMNLHPDCSCAYDVAHCDSKWRGHYYGPGANPVAGIETSETYLELIARVKNGKRDARKAQRLGYSVRRFHYPSWTPDIDAIHHSMPVRSGGRMQGHYREHLGPPAPMQEPGPVSCPRHWRHDFGAFAPDGHLVAYIGLVRVGDTATYMQIIGHGDHLATGVMFLLHFELMRWALSRPADLEGVGCIWYTDFRGAPGLATWKRKAGFREVML